MKPPVVSIVNYYNTIPLVYGLERFMPPGFMTLVKDPPSTCARKLLSGEADIGLVPVGAMIDVPGVEVIGSHCIGAENDVATVVLLSQCPVEEIEEIYLDAESRTSNLLVRVLSQNKWGITPRWIDPKPCYWDKIKGKTAGVMIGNKVFDHKDKFAYCTDMAGEWVHLTGLPFVFAYWASLNPVPTNFIKYFERAQERGIEELDTAIAATNTDFSFDVKSYLTRNIKFNLDAAKREAISRFTTYCHNLKA